MLGLKLRPEFASARLQETVVSLNKGAPNSFVNQETSRILEITYPTIDVLRSLEACFNPEERRCLVIMGDRGQGKSHIMGLLHHAYRDPSAVTRWLDQWKERISYQPNLSAPLSQYLVITAALHEQEFPFLWSPIFSQHPEGKALQAKLETRREIEGSAQKTPSRSDLEAAFKIQPTVLIFDEFQTWYEGLEGVESKWAFNFVQILSEIAKDNPAILKLVVSVRDGESESYKQLHRMNPFIVNFQGETSKSDRHKLLVHRLFENRRQIDGKEIKGAIDNYFREWCRLLNRRGPDVQESLNQQVISWPFSIDLLQVLDEQMTLSLNVQGTRDFIIVLANLYKKVGEHEPIITPAHFGLDEDKDEDLRRFIAAVGNNATNRLAKIALQNIKVVREGLKERCPAIAERALASLYIRSLTLGNRVGATREQIQADLSISQPYQDAIFKDDWGQICDNSYNVHEIDGRYAFRVEENPRTKLLAHARNDKIFQQGEDAGKDIQTIRNMIEATFAPRNAANLDSFRYCILGNNVDSNPFDPNQFNGKNPSVDIGDGQACYVFFPVALEYQRSKAKLSYFVHLHLKKYRNLCRFVIPRINVYEDGQIILLARAYYFAKQWSSQPEYPKLRDEYEKDLKAALASAFTSVWIIDKWNHGDLDNSTYVEIPVSGRPQDLMSDVDRRIEQDHFSIDEVGALIDGAVGSKNVEQQKFSFLRSLIEEPRPFPQASIPWTGPTHLFEVIRQGCLEGKYAIRYDGGVLQTSPQKTLEEIRRALPPLKWNQWNSYYVVPRQNVPGGSGIPEAPAVGPIAGPAGPGPQSPIGGPIATRVSTVRKDSGFAKRPIEIEDEIERWGVVRAQRIHDVSITVKQLSGVQLKKIIQSISAECPDGEVLLGLLKEEEPS